MGHSREKSHKSCSHDLARSWSSAVARQPHPMRLPHGPTRTARGGGRAAICLESRGELPGPNASDKTSPRCRRAPVGDGVQDHREDRALGADRTGYSASGALAVSMGKEGPYAGPWRSRESWTGERSRDDARSVIHCPTPAYTQSRAHCRSAGSRVPGVGLSRGSRASTASSVAVRRVDSGDGAGAPV